MLNKDQKKAILKLIGLDKAEIEKLSEDNYTSRLLLLYSQHLDERTKDVDIKDATPTPEFKTAAEFISGEKHNELELLIKNY